MKTKTLVLAILSVLIFASWQNHLSLNSKTQKAKEIPYTIAERYFVKNTFKSLKNPKIETAEKFEEIFGMATIMGNNGKPTEIDFTKKYVIAVILPVTEYETTIKPVSLQKNSKNEVVFSYKIEKKEEKRSFSIQPCLVLIVGKENTGKVVLSEKK